MKIRTIVFLLLVCGLVVSYAWGTERYALQTGKDCAACHLNPAGGGELTSEGKVFRSSLPIAVTESGTNLFIRILRFVAGFIHLFIAILWFGTILYVHLVLKPAYAAQGLPRGEMFVGLLSMVLIALSGMVLTLLRVSSFDMMFHTRFGILLSIKIGLFLIMAGTAMFVVLVIGPRLKRSKPKETVSTGGDLGPEVLAGFDGREGRSAYIAYKGLVYDVTAGRFWKQGLHAGRHPAGMDLTDVLKLAPHGEDKILAMPVVGKFLQGKEPGRPLHEKVFFFMAYMNLILVICIIFIISLWRWW